MHEHHYSSPSIFNLVRASPGAKSVLPVNRINSSEEKTSEILGTSYNAVNGWGTNNRGYPYWVESWLRGCLRACCPASVLPGQGCMTGYSVSLVAWIYKGGGVVRARTG